jgi:hypothetical protein
MRMQRARTMPTWMGATIVALGVCVSAVSGEVEPDAPPPPQRFTLVSYEVFTPRHRRNPTPVVIARYAGTLVAHTAAMEQGVLLHDAWDMVEPRQRVEMRYHYADRTLRQLQQIDAVVMRGGTVAGATIRTQASGPASLTTLPATADAAPRSVDYPADTVTFAAVMRIVCELPRAAGASIALPRTAEAMRLVVIRPTEGEPAITLTCDGDMALQLSGRIVECAQYTLQLPGEREPWRFWVDSHGRLRQFAMGMTLLGTADEHDFFAANPVIDELLVKHRPSDAP